MAEIVVKIGSNGASPLLFQDGDIVSAYNSTRIKSVHAQHICHVSKGPLNSDGLLIKNGLQWRYRFITSTHMNIRRSPSQYERINLVSGVRALIEGADLAVNTLSRGKNGGLFGIKGKEAWFSGVGHRGDGQRLNMVWDMIESNSAFREIDHRMFPASSWVKKSFLLLSINDLNNSERDDLVSEKTVNGVVVAVRRNKVDWRGLQLPEPASRIVDSDIEIDLRGNKTHDRLSIVRRM